MFWWGILRTRTTCKLPLQVVKHLNKSTNPELESYNMLQRDGPGRIWAHDHLLPRLLQNAPGALGGFKWKIIVLDSDLPFPLLKQE